MDALEHPLLAPGRLVLTACPGRARRYHDAALDDDLGALRAEGVGRIVGLVPDDELASLGLADLEREVEARGFRYHRLPVTDGAVPLDDDALAELLTDLEGHLAAGEAIAIHCRAGLGRAGTLAAAVLVARGLEPEAAIEAVREARVGAIETDRQAIWLAQLPDLLSG